MLANIVFQNDAALIIQAFTSGVFLELEAETTFSYAITLKALNMAINMFVSYQVKNCCH
jgi:hypothetical protein